MRLKPTTGVILMILLTLTLTACDTADLIIERVIEAATNADSQPIQEVQPVATASPVAVESTILSEEQTLIDLYEELNSSVVNIQIVGEYELPFSPNSEGAPEPDLPEDHPDIPEFEPFDPGPLFGQGSGFVYDAAGHIVTNNHVVTDADKITVIFADGTEVAASVVGVDPDSDLAVIKVDPAEVALNPISVGDSDSLKVGQFVVAIGNPFGLEGTMTTGIISGLGRLLPAGASTPAGPGFSIPDIIQTDTAINPGNSGGPLINLQGEVVGVNTAIEAQSGTFAGVGYAVPSEIVSNVVPVLIAEGKIAHPWLGISGSTITRPEAEAMDLDPQQSGILIKTIIEGGPAEKAGLIASEEEIEIDGFPALVGGDIIVGIDDQVVEEFDDLLSYIVQETRANQKIELQIIRDGELLEVDATLEARPNGE